MADPSVAGTAPRPDSTVSPESALAAIESLLARANEIRGSAILGPAGVLAASGDTPAWGDAGQSLLEAADSAAGSRATHAHVATEEGEVFVVRLGALAMVAVASRFTLASLVFADMRAALRETLASEGVATAKEAA